jgi:hypothetical protein
VTRSCASVPEWLEDRRQERLAAADGQRLDGHLAGCGPCRRLAEETAPLPLFAGLTEGPMPAGVEEYILGGVHVEEQHPRRPGLLPVAWRAPWPALASLAAAAALVLVWAGGARRPAPAPVPPLEAWLPAHAMNDAVATVEDIRSETAEVLAFSLPEGAGGRTEVILIVDRSIDL